MSGDPAIPMLVDVYCRGLLDDAADADLYRFTTELATVHRPPPCGNSAGCPTGRGTTLKYGV